MEHIEDSDDVTDTPPVSGDVTLRLFAALAVGHEAADELAAHASSHVPHTPGMRLAAPEAMHVTFAFLGDVNEHYIPLVAKQLDEAASTVPGPTLCVTGAPAAFGGGHVLGFDVEVELLALVDAARDRFIDAVAPIAPGLDQRAWRPHISVARGVDDPLEVEPMTPVRWIAAELRLYASLPSPMGRQHRQLHAAPLGVPARRT